jgi:hypothetical protein
MSWTGQPYGQQQYGQVPPQFTGQNQFLQGQPTGFAPGLQPQPTGFGQTFGSRLTPQPTGYVGGYGAVGPGAIPPVPQLPSAYAGQQQRFTPQATGLLGMQPQQQHLQQRNFLSPSPGPLVGQPTGLGGNFGAQNLPNFANNALPTNFLSSFMPSQQPTQTGTMQFSQPALNQSFQQPQLPQTAAPRIPWALTAEERKSYDQIFRAWDQQGTGFISGTMAKEVFGQSGLERNDLMTIWYVVTSAFLKVPVAELPLGILPTLRTVGSSTSPSFTLLWVLYIGVRLPTYFTGSSAISYGS